MFRTAQRLGLRAKIVFRIEYWVLCTLYSLHSHSNVAGGFEPMSNSTRFTHVACGRDFARISRSPVDFV